MIRAVLDKHKGWVYYYMPVQNGMGRPSLDFIGCAAGLMFAIEAKAPPKSVTKRQQLTINEMESAGAQVFVVKDKDSLAEFEAWLGSVQAKRER